MNECYAKTLKRNTQLTNLGVFSKSVLNVFLLVSHATPDSLGLDNWGTWHRCWRWGLIVKPYKGDTELLHTCI